MPAGSETRYASKPRQPPRAGVRLVGPGTFAITALGSPRLPRVTQGLLVLLLAFLLAKLAWELLTPAGPFGAPPPIASATLSADPSLVERAFARGTTGGTSVPAADTAGWVLFGVRLAGEPGRSSAILGNAGGSQASFALGDELAPGVTLASVGPGHVILLRGGQRIRLEMPQAPLSAVPSQVPAALPAGRPAAEAAPLNPEQLLAQTGLRPRVREGKPDGYTLIPRGDGNMVRLAGLQPGDVLLEVNGQVLTPERIGELAELLRSSPTAVVTIDRGGERKTLTLQMEPP